VRLEKNNLLERLAAADPARGLPVESAARGAVWQLVLAAETPSARTAPRRAVRPRGRRRMRAVVVLGLLALATGALAAGGVLQFGTPAKLPPGYVNPVHSGLGAIKRGTVRLLPISAADPAGGPAWGLRVFSTSRDGGCVQVGRLLDGKLGALGQDGAFGNDGRFHVVPATPLYVREGCTTLDANRRIFTNATIGDETASAWTGHGSCVPSTATAAERRGAPSICPQGDERNLYYGLLGPEATSVTYVLDGQRHTLATVGPEGAYLIVTRADPHQLFNFAAGGTSDVVPVDGPITELHYRNGATCHLTARSWIGGAEACTPTLQVPVGYVAPRRVVHTSAEVAAPLRVRLARVSAGRYEVLVSFKSRIVVTHARSRYVFKFHEPHMSAKAYGFESNDSDIRAGQTVTFRTYQSRNPLIHALHRGKLTGEVAFVETNLPAEEESPGVLVGRFSVRVP
jgi:hypothetical protein